MGSIAKSQISSAKTWSRLASATLMIIGCLVLVGWVFNIPLLKSVLPSLATMKATSALTFVLTGVALWIGNSEQPDQRERRWSRIFALTVFIIGLLSIFEYVFGWNFGIDQLLFRDTMLAGDNGFLGRMSQALAFSFVLIGIALWLLHSPRWYALSQFIALVVAFIGLLALAGYLYNVEALYDVFVFTSLALHSALSLLIASIGILLARAENGPMGTLTADRPGKMLAHRLLPAVIILPLLFGWLCLKGEQAGLYNPGFGLAIFALSNITTFVALVYWNAGLLNKAAFERDEAANHVQKLNRVLSVLSDTNQSIVRFRDMPVLFDKICQIAVEKGSFRLARIGLLEADSKRYRIVAQAGNVEDYLKTFLDNKDGSDELAKDRLHAEENVIYNDIQSDPRTAAWRADALKLGYRGLGVFPLKVSGQARGVFLLYTSEAAFFDEEERNLLSEMALDIAFAMEFSEQENQRQQVEAGLKQYAQRMEILHTIDLGIIESRSIQPLVETVLKSLREIIPCQRANVVIADRPTQEAILFAADLSNPSPIGKGFRIPIQANMLDDEKSKQVHVFADFRDQADVSPIGKQLVNEGMVSALNAPLMDQGKVIGSLFLAADTPDFFTSQYQEIAVQIADQLAIAIRHMLLSKELTHYSTQLEQRVEQRTAELNRAKERVEAILNNSTEGILFIHTDLTIEQTNLAFNRLFACQTNDYLERLLLDLIHPDDIDGLGNVIQTVAIGATSKAIEIRCLRKDGVVFEAEIGLAYISVADKETEGFVCTIQDITERKRAELAIQQQRDFLQQIINNVPNIILVKDRAGQIQMVNDLTARLYRIAPAEMIGKTTSDFNPDEAQAAAVEQSDREALDSKQPAFIAEEIFMEHYFQTTKVPLRDTNGEFNRLLVVSVDITNLKQAEKALQEAFEKEKELSELKSRFVSMASHEFRNPLATILITADSLSAYREKMTDQQIEERLTKIKEQVNYLKDVMDDVLQLARLQARRADFNPVVLDLESLCRSVIDEFRNQKERSNAILFTCDDQLKQVKLDKKLMRQIISNLVSNAVKYSPAEKAITLRLQYVNKSLVFEVSDEGIGIPANDLNYLFEPFHRATNVGTISGTGLGLTIAKESVELHGGTITVESQVGAGTTFTVTIPITIQGEQNDDENPGH